MQALQRYQIAETPEQQPQQPCAQPPHTSQPAHILSEKRYINDAAHQLRTPLAGIISQAELALQETDPQRLRQRIETIHAAAQRGAQLVRQMLALARSEAHASNTEPIDTYDLATLAREVTREWVPKSLALSKDLGYEGLQTAWVRGNRFMMREAISNLIYNALLYTPPNGIITVSVKLADAPSHPPTNHASANHTSDPADGTHDKNHSGRGSTSSSARSNDNTSYSADSGNKDNNSAPATVSQQIANAAGIPAPKSNSNLIDTAPSIGTRGKKAGRPHASNIPWATACPEPRLDPASGSSPSAHSAGRPLDCLPPLAFASTGR